MSADTLAFLFAADAGVFAAVSAGNDGPGAATIGGPADVPWVTAVGATTYPTFYKGIVKLGNGKSIVGASVTRGTAKAPLIDRRRGRDRRIRPLPRRHARPRQGHRQDRPVWPRHQRPRREELEVERAGGIGMVLYNPTDVDDLFTDNFFVPDA